MISKKRSQAVNNNNLQRIIDSDYYQYFSYSLKSEVQYEKWKEAVDGIINAHNPMNAYDTEGNEMNAFGSGDASDFIEERFPIFQEIYGGQ